MVFRQGRFVANVRNALVPPVCQPSGTFAAYIVVEPAAYVEQVATLPLIYV